MFFSKNPSGANSTDVQNEIKKQFGNCCRNNDNGHFGKPVQVLNSPIQCYAVVYKSAKHQEYNIYIDTMDNPPISKEALASLIDKVESRVGNAFRYLIDFRIESGVFGQKSIGILGAPITCNQNTMTIRRTVDGKSPDYNKIEEAMIRQVIHNFCYAHKKVYKDAIERILKKQFNNHYEDLSDAINDFNLDDLTNSQKKDREYILKRITNKITAEISQCASSATKDVRLFNQGIMFYCKNKDINPIYESVLNFLNSRYVSARYREPLTSLAPIEPIKLHHNCDSNFVLAQDVIKKAKENEERINSNKSESSNDSYDLSLGQKIAQVRKSSPFLTCASMEDLLNFKANYGCWPDTPESLSMYIEWLDADKKELDGEHIRKDR